VDPHDNRIMEVNSPVVLVPDHSNAIALRRFWMAWLVFLLVMLAVFIVIILIAAVAADPVPISPAG
jgi:hypothetical protein